jgi:Mrp family chromosome partitioning ATPase
MSEVLAWTGDHYEFVVVDTPPLAVVRTRFRFYRRSIQSCS